MTLAWTRLLIMWPATVMPSFAEVVVLQTPQSCDRLVHADELLLLLGSLETVVNAPLE